MTRAEVAMGKGQNKRAAAAAAARHVVDAARRLFFVEANWLVQPSGLPCFADGCVLWLGRGQRAAEREMNRLDRTGWVGIRRRDAE